MGKTTTEMQLVAVSKLVPYVNNARTHNAQQITKLRSSLREFGFINPVIIDREYNVIAGHGRILAAKEEGIEEVPCVFVDYLTPAQKKAYILADNRMAMDVQGCRDSRTGGTAEPTEEEIKWWTEVFETHRHIMGTSSKSKTEKQIIKWLKDPHSDSAEYKMWGNGVALPNVVFVLSGIVYYS